MNMPSEFKDAVAKGLPVEINDGPDRYLIVRAETYERLLALLDPAEHSDDEKRFLLQQWGKSSGWESPGDEVFDALEPK